MKSMEPNTVLNGGEIMVYPVLETKIFQRGIKQKAIAKALGISTRSLYNKLKGLVPFTWPEVCIREVVSGCQMGYAAADASIPEWLRTIRRVLLSHRLQAAE